MEKAFAGEDRVWDSATRSAWKLNWRGLKPGVDTGRRLQGLRLSSPRTPPEGYNRLGVGTYSDDQANVLARLTGEEAVVKQLPPSHRELLAQLKSQLDNNKPIVVSSRDTIEGATYPDGIYANHAYEVDRVIGDEIELRNPWGYDHPEPMSARELLKFYKPQYVTLK
ncbi:hypothetical protein AB0L82_42500 [Nocardia sp. NPDC052001]|uniref:hypothetical protein n=1 Tax=Nocardia sp. NPDC052001 TaxID=3154853 RepID=UPI0034321B94